MAYYVSENDVHVVVRSEKKEFSPASGELMGKKRRVYARFQRGCPDWAVPLAQEAFPNGFKMRPEEYTLQRWIGWYDSDLDQQLSGWTDEEREEIERVLASRHGIVQVERKKAKPPFENYVKLTTIQGKRTEEHVVAKVREFVDELGVKVDDIVAFERDNPRKESEIILAALSQNEEKDEEVEPLVAA